MSPMLLLLMGLVLALAIRLFLSVVVAPRRRWVSAGRPRIAIAAPFDVPACGHRQAR